MDLHTAQTLRARRARCGSTATEVTFVRLTDGRDVEIIDFLDEFRNWYNHERPHKALSRNTPHQAYNALPKAGPQPLGTDDHRVRNDKVDTAGRITLRFAGLMRYLGIGRALTGTRTLSVITGTHAMTSNADTGEIIAEHDIDTNRRYQPNLIKNTRHRKTETP